MDATDIVSLIDRNTPGQSLNFKAIRAALGGGEYTEVRANIAKLTFEKDSHLHVDPDRAMPEKGAIVVGLGGMIVDGRHRTMLAISHGEKFISAWVPSNMASYLAEG